MILSVSTVSDTPENVEKFLRRNLLGGIDHSVVFLDEPLPDVERLLEATPHATLVRAYGDWWGGRRPDDLNERQVTNHGLASRLVAGLPWAEWVFALDGDEVARLDRSALDALDPNVRAVRLEPLEAVSRPGATADPTLFKRRPSPDELLLLRTLGVIAQPRLRAYFRGHVSGKPGLRPARGYAVGVHHALDTASGERLPAAFRPGLTMLHYESHSLEEFVRKWRALLASGTAPRQHGRRSPVARAVEAVHRLGLDDRGTSEALERLYRACAVDDVETLSRLRLLVEVDADRGERTPGAEPGAVGQLRDLLAAVHDLPKAQFRPRSASRRVDRTVARLQRRL